MKYVIIGGGTAGLSCATKIRRNDESASITIVEQTEALAVIKNGLATSLKPEFDLSKLETVNNEDIIKRYNLNIIFKQTVKQIDRQTQEVELASGSRITYDRLVIAVGKQKTGENYEVNNLEDISKLSDMLTTNNGSIINVQTDSLFGLEVASNLQLSNQKINIIFDEATTLADFDLEIRAEIINLLTNFGITFDQEYEASNIIDIFAKQNCQIAKIIDVETDENGLLVVNNNFQTSDPKVFAVGAIVDREFNANAAKNGRDLANYLTTGKEIIETKIKTTYLTIANQEFAAINYVDNQIKIKDSVIVHRLSHASYEANASNLSIKVTFSEDLQILSVMMYGNGVAGRVNPIVMAMNQGMTVSEFETLPLMLDPKISMGKEQLVTAMSSALNVNNKYRNFYFDQIDQIDGILIDVRTPIEYQLGHIEGSINIELNELRNNLDKIDLTNPLYVYCQAGLRANVAISILKAAGCSEIYNLSGGFKTYEGYQKYLKNIQIKAIEKKVVQDEKKSVSTKNQGEEQTMKIAKTIDATALQCPGPIMQVYNAMNEVATGEVIEITVSDFGFKNDIYSWCEKTGNSLVSCETNSNGKIVAQIQKGQEENNSIAKSNDSATIVMFSGDLDKAIAAMIIAQGAASLGKKVTIFCTFWGLNVLRKSEKVNIKKPINEKMFSAMMPRGADKLGISNMNMMGMGAKMIKKTMKDKDVYSLPELMLQAKESGVEFIACTMSMDVMGIHEEELLDYVSYGGVAKYVSESETAGLTLFI